MDTSAYFISLTEQDVHEYWNNQKSTIVITPEDIAGVALAQPPLVVTVEEPHQELAQQMVALINRGRLANAVEARGARPLQWDSRVARVAWLHSQDMLNRNFIDHVNPDGQTPFYRIKKAGIRFRCAGENLASGFSTIEAIEEAFMDEPPYEENHRANILNPCFTHVGIGIVHQPNGLFILTQNFIGKT